MFASGLALVFLNITINLAHDPLGPLYARINEPIGARASLWPLEKIVRRLHVRGGDNSGHDSDHSFPSFIHLGGTGRNLAQLFREVDGSIARCSPFVRLRRAKEQIGRPRRRTAGSVGAGTPASGWCQGLWRGWGIETRGESCSGHNFAHKAALLNVPRIMAE
jgi:hypothetical protein